MAALYYTHLSVHEVDADASMQGLYNNFNLTLSDPFDFTNIKPISINLFFLFLCKLWFPLQHRWEFSLVKIDKWSLNNTPIFSCAASNVCMAILKWEASRLLWGVCMLWCVKTAPTTIWWFIVILSVWASALFSDLYFPAPCGSFLLCVGFFFCLLFVTTIKELSKSLICLWNIKQEALFTVKTLMSSPPEQTLPSVSHPSHFQKLIWPVFSSVQENQLD